MRLILVFLMLMVQNLILVFLMLMVQNVKAESPECYMSGAHLSEQVGYEVFKKDQITEAMVFMVKNKGELIKDIDNNIIIIKYPFTGVVGGKVGCEDDS